MDTLENARMENGTNARSEMATTVADAAGAGSGGGAGTCTSDTGTKTAPQTHLNSDAATGSSYTPQTQPQAQPQTQPQAQKSASNTTTHTKKIITPCEGAPAFFVNNVSFSYNADQRILHNICLTIQPGMFSAVLGMNGSGKSTFMNCLMHTLSPQHGSVSILGHEIKQLSRLARAQLLTLVEQRTQANATTVYDALLLGRLPYLTFQPSAHDYAVVERIIERLSLGAYQTRLLNELSGGEFQKVAIARALVQETDVLLLDEPTNNLDITNQIEVMKLVCEQVKQMGSSALAIMHDINLALRYCNHFVVMKSGTIYACGGSDIITEQLVYDVYGIRADIVHHKGYAVVMPSE